MNQAIAERISLRGPHPAAPPAEYIQKLGRVAGDKLTTDCADFLRSPRRVCTKPPERTRMRFATAEDK